MERLQHPLSHEWHVAVNRHSDEWRKAGKQLNQQVVSMAYDGVYILKDAVEATKSFDGATIAAWMEKNAGSVKSRTNGPLAASADNHFLVGPDAIVFVNRPDQKRADGAALRNCS